MSDQKRNPGPRLTEAQRQQVLAWIADGQQSDEIRGRMLEQGMPLITRKAISFYRVRLRKNLPVGAQKCLACGQSLPKSGEPASGEA